MALMILLRGTKLGLYVYIKWFTVVGEKNAFNQLCILDLDYGDNKTRYKYFYKSILYVCTTDPPWEMSYEKHEDSE